MPGPRLHSGSPAKAAFGAWVSRLPGVGRLLTGAAAWLPFFRGVPEGETAPRSLALFLALFVGGMVLISLLGDQGLIAYRRLRGQAVQLRGDVEQLKSRRMTLSVRIRALEEDPAYIELVARRRLGLVRPGDTIVQLPRPRRRP